MDVRRFDLIVAEDFKSYNTYIIHLIYIYLISVYLSYYIGYSS